MLEQDWSETVLSDLIKSRSHFDRTLYFPSSWIEVATYYCILGDRDGWRSHCWCVQHNAAVIPDHVCLFPWWSLIGRLINLFKANNKSCPFIIWIDIWLVRDYTISTILFLKWARKRKKEKTKCLVGQLYFDFSGQHQIGKERMPTV